MELLGEVGRNIGQFGVGHLSPHLGSLGPPFGLRYKAMNVRFWMLLSEVFIP